MGSLIYDTDRAFYNSLLEVVGGSNLTDAEFSTITYTGRDVSLDLYNQLNSVLISRGTIGSDRERFVSLFNAFGVSTVATSPSSNIFVGAEI